MNPSEFDNYGSIEYWKTRPPEEVLEAFIYELKSPLTPIKGWVEILQMEDNKELHPRALESISTMIEKNRED